MGSHPSNVILEILSAVVFLPAYALKSFASVVSAQRNHIHAEPIINSRVDIQVIVGPLASARRVL